MGGLGSGSWYRWQGRKSTVEESLTLAVRDFRGRIYSHASGSFTWTRHGGHESSIGYYVTGSGCDASTGPIITLHYCWRDSENIEGPIRLQTTATQFGGKRWWFTCPLIVGDIPCQRRVGKLHLPPGARYFGCRHCHNLTYRSSQEAHQRERLLAGLFRMEGLDSLDCPQR